MFISNEKLRDILINAGLIDEASWSDALKNAMRLEVPVEDILRERDIIAGHLLYEIVAEALKLKYVNLKTREVSDEVLALFTNQMVGEHKAIPFELDAKKKILKVAFLDPTNKKNIAAVQRKIRYALDVHFCGINSYKFASRYYQKGVAVQVKKLIETLVAHRSTIRSFEAMFDKIIEYVYYTQPSDIHIEHMRDGGMVKFRVDGFLRDEFTISKPVVDFIVSKIKRECGVKTDQHHQTRDGHFSRKVFGEIISFRVSVMPTYFGEKICMRVLNESYQKMSLSELGFLPHSIQTIKRELKRPFGLVLISGPTGSGKSSTLYTLLKSLNVEGVSIASIEDPVEYSIKHINQSQVDLVSGYTFASGLRTILRQDPDVVMVGEIRDGDTAAITVQAALTGHTVLSTVHANSAAGSVTRLKNMDVRSYLLAPTLSLVISQRLIKGLCPSCRESYPVTKAILDDIAKDVDAYASLEKLRKLQLLKFERFEDIRFYRGTGCAKCKGKGVLGRVGAFEIMTVNAQLADLILKEKPESALHKAAEANGMLTMFEDGLIKVLAGLTTISEVMRVVQ